MAITPDTLDSVMHRPERVFKHFQVVVLIYRFFEKVWSVDFASRNPTSDQNFFIVQQLFNFNQVVSFLAKFYCFVVD